MLQIVRKKFTIMLSFFNNPMVVALVWVMSVGMCFGLATLWMTYLIKIIMNDYEIQEKIRRHKRISEELLGGDGDL